MASEISEKPKVYTRAGRKRAGMPPPTPLFKGVPNLPQRDTTPGSHDTVVENSRSKGPPCSENSSSDDDEEEKSLWVQCDGQHCRKWRRLPLGYTSDFSQDWYCHMHPDPAHQSCDIPNENWRSSDFRRQSFTFSCLRVGQLIWAKLRGFPPWPALVSPDPWSKESEFVCEEEEGCIYHVEFLGKPRTHSWIPEGQVEPYCGTAICSLGTVKMSKKLDFALQEASALLPLTSPNRLQTCEYTTENFAVPPPAVVENSSVKCDPVRPRKSKTNQGNTTLMAKSKREPTSTDVLLLGSQGSMSVHPLSAVSCDGTGSSMSPLICGKESVTLPEGLQYPAQAKLTGNCTHPVAVDAETNRWQKASLLLPTRNDHRLPQTASSRPSRPGSTKNTLKPHSTGEPSKEKTRKLVGGTYTARRCPKGMSSHGKLSAGRPQSRGRKSISSMPISHTIHEYFKATGESYGEQGAGPAEGVGTGGSDQLVPDYTRSAGVLESEARCELQAIEEMLRLFGGEGASAGCEHAPVDVEKMEVESVLSEMAVIEGLMLDLSK